MTVDMKKNILICDEKEKVWVIGDVHGCYKQFMEIINSSQIARTDIVIIIGDIIDRGHDSVKMLEWVMKNVNNGGKYLMIRGNHEQNIIEDYTSLLEEWYRKNKYIIDKGELPADYKEQSIYDLECEYEFCEYMERAGITNIGQAEKYIDWMRTLPLYFKVKLSNGKTFVIAHGWFEGKLTSDGEIEQILPNDDIVWNRDIDSDYNLVKDDYNPMEKGEMLIHGHTPIIVIKGHRAKLATPIFRPHSVNIDGGCFMGKQYGGRLIALCLNNFKVIYSD